MVSWKTAFCLDWATIRGSARPAADDSICQNAAALTRRATEARLTENYRSAIIEAEA
jgi:hypothetical protein